MVKGWTWVSLLRPCGVTVIIQDNMGKTLHGGQQRRVHIPCGFHFYGLLQWFPDCDPVAWGHRRELTWMLQDVMGGLFSGSPRHHHLGLCEILHYFFEIWWYPRLPHPRELGRQVLPSWIVQDLVRFCENHMIQDASAQESQEEEATLEKAWHDPRKFGNHWATVMGHVATFYGWQL